MRKQILPALLLCSTFGFLKCLYLRRQFLLQIEALESEIRKRSAKGKVRLDLPLEVLELANRLGASAETATDFVHHEQLGQMWSAPGGKPITFSARQTIRIDAPGYVWRAEMGPVIVVDYFVKGIGGLIAKILGVITLAKFGGGSANKGELLRYLAELPWYPDAILMNTFLEWTVIDASTIKVASGQGSDRGEITFELDETGLIVRASAPSRGYAEKNGQISEYPWHGRFWEYQRSGRHFIPMQGEVAWGLPEGDFIYWRGRLIPHA